VPRATRLRASGEELPRGNGYAAGEENLVARVRRLSRGIRYVVMNGDL